MTMAVSDFSAMDQSSYVRQTVACLWEHLPAVLLAGLGFTLLSVPALFLFDLGFPILAVIAGALTIAPAWTAVLAHEVACAQEEAAGIGDWFRALGQYWGRSAQMGLCTAFPLLAALLTAPGLARPEASVVVWLGLLADVAGALVLAALSLYAFPLLILHEADVVIVLRTAIVLASGHITNTLGLLALAVLFAFAIAYVSSGLVFFLPAVWGMFVVNNCRLVVAEESRKV